MKAVAITSIVIFVLIIIALSTLTALVLYRHNELTKEAKNKPAARFDRSGDIEARWARKNKACIGEPPRMPAPCITWNWNERDYKIGTVISYYCRHVVAARTSTPKVVRRAECNTKNRWEITYDTTESCFCPTTEEALPLL